MRSTGLMKPGDGLPVLLMGCICCFCCTFLIPEVIMVYVAFSDFDFKDQVTIERQKLMAKLYVILFILIGIQILLKCLQVISGIQLFNTLSKIWGLAIIVIRIYFFWKGAFPIFDIETQKLSEADPGFPTFVVNFWFWYFIVFQTFALICRVLILCVNYITVMRYKKELKDDDFYEQSGSK